MPTAHTHRAALPLPGLFAPLAATPRGCVAIGCSAEYCTVNSAAFIDSSPDMSDIDEHACLIKKEPVYGDLAERCKVKKHVNRHLAESRFIKLDELKTTTQNEGKLLPGDPERHIKYTKQRHC